MIKITKTYVDYNEVERTEDFYFNLTKAEVTEMELGKEGGISAYIKAIIAAKDMPELIKLFKEIVLKAYGQKSLDGRRFIKNAELTEDFSQTEAYSMIFMELATDSNKAAEFINGVMPKDLVEQANKANANNAMPITK